MYCRFCERENDLSAKFCYNCSRPLDITSQYPEYSFIPAKLYYLKGNKGGWKKAILAITVMLITFSVWLLIGLVNFQVYKDNLGEYMACGFHVMFEPCGEYLFCIISWLLFFSFFAAIGFAIKYFLSIRDYRIDNKVDYVEGNHREFIVVVNGLKFGMYDRLKRKFVIPCEYDSLVRSDDTNIVLRKGQESFKINICNLKE